MEGMVENDGGLKEHLAQMCGFNPQQRHMETKVVQKIYIQLKKSSLKKNFENEHNEHICRLNGTKYNPKQNDKLLRQTNISK